MNNWENEYKANFDKDYIELMESYKIALEKARDLEQARVTYLSDLHTKSTLLQNDFLPFKLQFSHLKSDIDKIMALDKNVDFNDAFEKYTEMIPQKDRIII